MKINQVFSSFEKKNDYFELVQININSSFLERSLSSNSRSLPRIFARSSSQLRLFSSAAKSSSSQPCWRVYDFAKISLRKT